MTYNQSARNIQSFGRWVLAGLSGGALLRLLPPRLWASHPQAFLRAGLQLGPAAEGPRCCPAPAPCRRLQEPGQELGWRYDIGDNWRHVLKVVEVSGNGGGWGWGWGVGDHM